MVNNKGMESKKTKQRRLPATCQCCHRYAEKGETKCSRCKQKGDGTEIDGDVGQKRKALNKKWLHADDDERIETRLSKKQRAETETQFLATSSTTNNHIHDHSGNIRTDQECCRNCKRHYQPLQPMSIHSIAFKKKFCLIRAQDVASERSIRCASNAAKF